MIENHPQKKPDVKNVPAFLVFRFMNYRVADNRGAPSGGYFISADGAKTWPFRAGMKRRPP